MGATEDKDRPGKIVWVEPEDEPVLTDTGKPETIWWYWEGLLY